MTGVYTLIRLRGPEATEKRTGRRVRTRIVGSEVCDAERDSRSYVVREWVGSEVLRTKRIEVPGGYHGEFRPAAREARGLAQQWAEGS